MELYIPPPSSFLPRLPPPRPVVPAVPIVPVPDLPEKVHAPEGVYTLNSSLFPSIGTPSAPLPFDPRSTPSSSAFIGGAGGFIVAPPGPTMSSQPGQTAMSFGSTVVNGQTQPAHPVRMNFINIYFPPKIGGGQEKGSSSFGGFMGMGKGDTSNPNAGLQSPTSTGLGLATSPSTGGIPGYEPSVSSESSDPTASDMIPPTPMEIPLSAIPQQTTTKRRPFARATTTAVNTLPRPKNNLRSSNSTFVTRLQALDNLPKVMAERGRNGGEMVRWGFWNLGRTFGWGETGGKVKEALARVTFSQVPTCHAVSPFTASPERLDIIVGFASGDLVWLDFIAGRYTRINKGGLLNNSAVASVHFDPRHPHHFIASFTDSTILQFNMFAEDPVFLNGAPTMPWVTQFEREEETLEPSSPTLDKNNSAILSDGETEKSVNVDGSPVQSTQAIPSQQSPEQQEKKLNGSGKVNGKEEEAGPEVMLKWKNTEFGSLGEISKKGKNEERPTWAGRNPIAAFKVVRRGMTALSYSPDGRWLAVVAEDGKLRLVDVAEQKLTDVFGAYFGDLNCVAWSPDSRFIAVGGQDDLITIYSARETRVVARCQGHSAFVLNIAFDHSRGGGYRFGSVGEDGKLVLWDFTAAQLHRPRHHAHHLTDHHRGSTTSLPRQHSQSHLPLGQGTSINALGTQNARFHEAPPRSEVALLQPVMARMVEGNLLTGICFTPEAIFTISRAAQIKIWERPPRQTTSKRRTAVAKSKDKVPGSPGPNALNSGVPTTPGSGHGMMSPSISSGALKSPRGDVAVTA